MNEKAYISLPITGHDIEDVRERNLNAEYELDRRGYDFVSPLNVSTDLNAPYSERMGKDIAALLECDMVYFLRGWGNSRDCRLEYAAARIYGKEIMFE